MDGTTASHDRPASTQAGGVTRRRFLTSLAATSLVWVAPAVVKHDAALSQAVISPPPPARDVGPGRTARDDREPGAAVRGRTIERGAQEPGTAVRGRSIERGGTAGADPNPRVDAAVDAADTADTLTATGTDAWKLAGTAAVTLAAGSLAVWGHDREPTHGPVAADDPTPGSS